MRFRASDSAKSSEVLSSDLLVRSGLVKSDADEVGMGDMMNIS